ncbi:NAD(P)/FAD-dependent oxidoreductase [Xylanimonas sp. McL0601]|uniref:NAD(P)/FAD-dependent oxidoreductase n=1 Tax=Xylanimonas sp. McL0601 TaxID=3414739 RepID=UPI003CF3AB11
MRTQILVLGAGYAGVMAANRLTQRDDVDIMLVNPRPHFVERIRLHQLVGGTHDAVQPFAHVLADAVRVVVDEAAAIDAPRRRVLLANGDELSYDYLVYAVGSSPSDSGVPGVDEHAFPVSSFESATQLRRALADEPDAPVVVVGGGPTGIETAAELAEQGRDVTLVAGTVVAPYFNEPGRRSLTKRLLRLGVTVITGTRVTRVTDGFVELADGQHVPTGITVWATGFEPSDLAARSGLATDPEGRLLADETLTSIDDDRIVGAGDAVSPSGVPERMSCQAAEPLGMRAAETVLARLAGRRPELLANPFFGQCVALGRGGATAQISRSDDTATWMFVGGKAGAWLKEQVCVLTVTSLVKEARKPGSMWNPSTKARRHVLEAAKAETAAPAQATVVA